VSADNAEQIAYWSGSGGAAWAASAARMDRELDRLGRLAMDALGPAPGSAVLDVGCGTGATTIELARRVGPAGRVVGVDVSGTLLEIARRRAGASGLGNLRFVRADAQHLTARTPFDAVFSRFGVMFFADPVAAFAQLRGCTSPGGQLGFVCWQQLADNPWFSAASAALTGAAGGQSPPDPCEPGPFAFADGTRIRQILTGAGWREVRVRRQVDELALDDATVQDRVAFAVHRGPAAAALADASAAERAQAAARVRAALQAFERAGAVRFRRAVWVVTART
jgi:SAM-dependent methyltransferase